VSVIRHAGRFTPDDWAASTWQYLPADVPAGCAGLDVTLSYERIGGILDLGCVAPDGWRGWSGGARDRFVITPHDATPGYLPGELEPGTWHVVLGLHRVPVQGVGYELTITTGPTAPASEAAPPPVAPRPPRRDLPAPVGLQWLAGDFHAHTRHSDGANTIDALATLAAARGLDFIAVTDHNTISHHPHLAAAGARAGLTLIPGQEVTTDSGHANAFGDIGWIDFCEPAQNWIDTVAARGGLLSINHPINGDCSWRKRASAPPVAEIWHSSWRDRHDGGPLSWWAVQDYAHVPIGGSDWHGLGVDSLPGSPTTWVACADGDVLDGLRAGRTSISAERNGPLLLRVGDELLVLGGEGTVLLSSAGRRQLVRGERAHFPGAPGPHVLESLDRVVLALCG
jgi:hypothetical protein